MKAKYRISDGDTMVSAGTLAETNRTCPRWYGQVFEGPETERATSNLKRRSVAALSASNRDWGDGIVATVAPGQFQGRCPVKSNLVAAET